MVCVVRFMPRAACRVLRRVASLVAWCGRCCPPAHENDGEDGGTSLSANVAKSFGTTPRVHASAAAPAQMHARYGGVFAGGALGTLARCGICAACGLGFSHPIVILGINLVGSWILGLIQTGCSDERPQLKQFLSSGFCGAFTTYATFIAIVASLRQSLVIMLGYALISLVGGVACARLGRIAGARLNSLRSSGVREQ